MAFKRGNSAEEKFKQLKLMSHHKIKTTSGMFLLQFLFAALIFLLVFLLPTILTIGGTTPILLCFAVVLFSHFFMFKARALTGTTPMNQVHMLMDSFFKTKRAVADGVYGKNLWDVVSYTINLEAITTCDLVEDIQCDDGVLIVTGIVTTRPDWSGTERQKTENMLNFVSFKEGSRSKALGATAKENIRERIKDKPAHVAVKMSGKAMLNIRDFDYVKNKIGSKIELVSIFDVNFSKDLEEARLAIARGRALAMVARILIDEGGFDPGKAQETATLLDKNIDNSKSIYELQGVPPGLFTVIDAVSKTLKNVKDAISSGKSSKKPSPKKK